MISYLQAENIAKSFGDVNLFDDLSLSIHKDQKIALIAKNGTGKTTIINILAGKDSPDDGKITARNDISIGYLEQDPPVDPNSTVFQAVFASSSEIINAIQRYERAMLSNDQALQQKSIDEMDRIKAWDYEVKVKQILNELKITNFDQKVNELSGGQKKRLALANVLINEPDLLILDEPTNHLDLEMIEWLEDLLMKTKCTLFMVTHDRYFLDRVCNEIIELEDKQLYVYKGNYSYFLEKREERLQLRNAEIDKARNIMRKELEWMRRMPSARTTKAKYRVSAFYETQDKASQKLNTQQVNINVQTARLGKKILNMFSVNKSFDDLKILEDFNYLFAPYEKIGMVGNNGTGKTTMLDIITGVQEADTGRIELGETVVFGYYRQDGLNFTKDQKVIDIARDIADVVNLGDGKKMSVSQFLNYFLFPPKMQQVYVSKLSGGEKRRLYLLTILMKSPNFLVLDEPTNDLDILTLNVLEDFLQNFNGCLLIVSHDRFFMDKVVGNLFVFEGEGIVKNFPGNYTEYRKTKTEQDKQKKLDAPKKEAKEKPIKEPSKKLSYKDKREMEMLETEIQELEDEKSSIENAMNYGNLPSTELVEKSTRLNAIIGLLETKEMRWLELSEFSE